ncbi:MAG TPA: hypothetical protein VFE91_02230, partial [Nitrososphaerales archaeon]|nr:hypothetical protein [Nitrososphaerales archaeon]
SKIDFVGSAYCCFHKFTAHHVALNLSNPLGKALDQYYGATAFSYNASREQDRLLNRTGTSVVATFVDKPGHYIAAFVHRYHSGYVIAYGAYGSDAVGLDPSVEYFVVGALTADLSKISLSLPSNGVQPIGGSPGAEVVGSLAVIGGTLLVIAYLVVRSERKSGSVSAGDYV